MSILSSTEGERVEFGRLGVRFMATGEGFSLVEHPIAPRTLAAPMHVREREDEYSYVLEGEVGVQIGGDVRYARPGDLVGLAALQARYGLRMDMDTVATISEREGLPLPPSP
jgi:hypothetical protein